MLNDILTLLQIFAIFCGIIATCCYFIYNQKQLRKDLDNHLKDHENKLIQEIRELIRVIKEK